MIGADAGSAVRTARTAFVARDFALCAIVGFAAIFAHRDALAAMVGLWNVSPMYSYGFTVPVISGYLLWTRRARLAGLTPRPAWLLGSLTLVVAVAVSATARIGGIQVLDQLAFLVTLTAGVLLLFGTAHVKAAWAALAYLVLMIPLWDGFTETLHQPFQLRSAGIGVWLLQMMGIPAYRDGVFIDLPTMQIEVARACSGVNYLVAVVALGLPLAYLFLNGIWRRLALLLFAVAVAALSNGLRVALIGILVHLEIGSPLHGPFHVLHGLFVAGIGYVALFAGLRVLSKSSPSPAATASATSSSFGPSPHRTPVSVGSALVITAILVGLGLNAFWKAPAPVSLETDLNTFPVHLGSWLSEGEPGAGGVAATFWPGADSALLRRYRRSDGTAIDLYIGYFSSQRQNKEMVNARAVALHRGATVTRVSDTVRGLEVNRTRTVPDGLDTLFWYQLDRTAEASPDMVRLKTLWNSIRHGRTNGAVVVLTLRGGAGGEEALREFGLLVEQALIGRLPNRRA